MLFNCLGRRRQEKSEKRYFWDKIIKDLKIIRDERPIIYAKKGLYMRRKKHRRA